MKFNEKKGPNYMTDERRDSGDLIDEVIDILEDGRWYSFSGITNIFLNVGVYEGNIGRIISFLNEYGFVNLDNGGKRVKINTSFSRFLQAIKTLEKNAKIYST